MPSQKAAHYFPGHMKKALEKIGPVVKSVDMVVEIVDSRAPFSTRNPILDSMIGSKPRVILMSKEDLSDKETTNKWKEFYLSKGFLVISANLKGNKILSLLKDASSPIIKVKREKEAKIGMKPQPIRIMVVGVPNVGKSTFINSVVGARKAVVGNKAGVTRGQQWVRVSSDFDLLDTPGVLPMNYPDTRMALRLALLGNMKEEVLPTEELAICLLGYLRENYPSCLKERFGIEDLNNITSDEAILAIASKRGLLEGSNPSVTKASYLLIKEFKEGIIGNISLEVPNA